MSVRTTATRTGRLFTAAFVAVAFTVVGAVPALATAYAPVVRPTVADAHLDVVLGETVTLDLDTLVTPGTGVVTGFEWDGGGEGIATTYDADTHVLTFVPSVVDTHWVSVRATAVTPDADPEEDETSSWASIEVTVSKAPEIPIVASFTATPAATTTSTSAHFAVTSDAVGATLGYVLDLPEDAQSASGVEVEGMSFDVTGLAVGRHWIRVVVFEGERWVGLDYAWEVVAPAATVTAPAPVLAATAIPAALIRAGIHRGATGPSVTIIQGVVGATADGRFGPATRAAVIAFQRAHGLTADGIVGPVTWAAIVAVANGNPVPASTVLAGQVARGIHQGASGSAVATIQQIVGASADGRFGPRTASAVRAWQRSHGLVADGIVGPLTWAAMTGV